MVKSKINRIVKLIGLQFLWKGVLYCSLPILFLTACDQPSGSKQSTVTQTSSPAAVNSNRNQEVSFTSRSEQGHFTATLYTGTLSRDSLSTTINNDKGPASTALPIGQFLNWSIELRDSEGTPVYPALLAVSGGMPTHGHGLPSQPQVTQYLDHGRYKIEGIKFNMAGQWVLQFQVQSEQQQDRIEFSFNVTP